MTLRFIVGRILRELIGVCPPVPAGRRRLAPCAVRNRGRAVRLLVSIIPPDRIVFSIQIPSQPVTELYSQRHIAPVFGLDAAYPYRERVRRRPEQDQNADNRNRQDGDNPQSGHASASMSLHRPRAPPVPPLPHAPQRSYLFPTRRPLTSRHAPPIGAQSRVHGNRHAHAVSRRRTGPIASMARTWSVSNSMEISGCLTLKSAMCVPLAGPS